MFKTESRVVTVLFSMLIVSDAAQLMLRATDAVRIVVALAILAFIGAVVAAATINQEKVRWVNGGLTITLLGLLTIKVVDFMT